MTGPVGGAGARPPERAPGAVVRVGTAPPVAASVDIEASLRDVLARTGLDLAQLLAGGADALVARPPTDPVALADVLERARAALVRNAPQELLAALDREWVGAAREPAGWYYRAAALALLGLPGEADRVLGDGLALHDTPALRFARSVVRLAQGDVVGARATLPDDAPGLTPPMPEPARRLLRAWDALLLAHRGHDGAAEQVVRQLASDAPAGDAVLAWLRRALARSRLDDARQATLTPRASRTVEPSHAELAAPTSSAPMTARPTPASVRPLGLDPLDQALRQLGARLREGAREGGARESGARDGGAREVGPRDGAARAAAGRVPEVLSALQSLATGGALWDAAQPGRVLAARAVLTLALQVLLDPRSDADGAGPGLRDAAAPDAASREADATRGSHTARAALVALLDGDVARAQRMLPRVAATEGAPIAEALARLLDAPPADGPDVAPAAAAGWGGTDAPTGRGEPSPTGVGATIAGASRSLDDQLAVPLRLGLVFVPVPVPVARPPRTSAPDGVLLDGRFAADREASAAPRDAEDARVRSSAARDAARRRWPWLLALLAGAVWWLSR